MKIRLIFAILFIAMLSACGSTVHKIQLPPFPGYPGTHTMVYTLSEIQTAVSYEERQIVSQWLKPWETFRTIRNAVAVAKMREKEAERQAILRRQQAEKKRAEHLRRQRAAAAARRQTTPKQTAKKPVCSLSLWDILPIPGPWKLLTLRKAAKIQKMRKAGICK